MLSKFDLDEIRSALEVSNRSTLATVRGRAVASGLAALDRLIERERHCNYANYETFLVKLHIDNSHGTKAEALQLARDHSNEGCDLADALKDFAETWAGADVSENTLGGDLASAALGNVDWREIAGELADEIAEGVE